MSAASPGVVRWGSGPVAFELESSDRELIESAEYVFGNWRPYDGAKLHGRWRAERQADYNKAAEIRYGRMAEIDRKLQERVAELLRTRERIAQLSGGDRLFVLAEVADYLDRLRKLGVSERTVQLERDLAARRVRATGYSSQRLMQVGLNAEVAAREAEVLNQQLALVVSQLAAGIRPEEGCPVSRR